MRVGSLEIEIMAGIARLQKDMNDAQRIVGGSMANVEKSVNSAKRAMQALGVGLPLIGIIDQVRRMTDQYTKLDAQLRLSTKTQAQYAQGMIDLRRISAVAQSDINATSMLYTRLMQVTDGMGVSQEKIATITETVSYGLKAYGATAQEAASASLQLSQAMGANRLGGEEFRAVMEAMPNVMKVLAKSMGVPLGELRALSIAGKITAEEMVKAFGDPAIAAQFKQMALNTQTVTGAWVVARNELMLLVGEFGKSSGGVNIFIGVFKALGETFALMAQYMQQLISLATVMAVLYAGRYVVAMQSAWMVTRAHTEALAMDAAGNAAHAAVVAQAKAAEVVASKAAAAAKLKETVAAREALFAAEAEMVAKAAAARATIAQTEAVLAATVSMVSNTAAKQANVAATAELALAEAALTKINKARNAAQVEAIAMDAVRTREMKAQTVATAAAAAAEEARVAATLSGFAKIRAFAVSNAFGLIGLAMWGAYEIADHLGWIDKVFDSADTRLKKLREDILSAREIPSQAGRNASADAGAFNVIPGLTEDIVRTYFKSVGDVSQDFRSRVMSDSFVFSKDFLSKEQEKAAKAAKITADYYAAMDKLQKTAGLSGKAYADAAIVLYNTKLERLDALNKEEIAAAKDSAEKQVKYNAEMSAKLADIEKDRLYAAFAEDKAARIAHSQFLLTLELGRIKDTAQAEQEANQETAAAAIREYLRRGEASAEVNAAYVAQQEELAKAEKERWKMIDGFAHDAFDNIFDKGENAFEEIGKVIKKSILDMLYKMTMQKWMINISVAGGGVGASSMASAAGLGNYGGGTGLMDIASSGLGMAMSGLTASQALTAASAYGSAALSASSLAEGISMATSGLSLAMPYIGAAIAVFSLLKGNKSTPTTSLGHAVTSFSPTGVQTGTQSLYGGSSAAVDAQIASMQTGYMKAAIALGIGATAQQWGFAMNTGANGQRQMFGLSGGGFEQTETAFSDEAVRLAASRAVFAALQGSELPQYLSRMFDGLTASTMTQQDIDNTLAFAGSVKQMRDALLETRAPLEVLRANVDAGTEAFATSAATFRNDFVAAIDAGISPQVFEQWKALGTAIDQLAAADADAAAQNAEALARAAEDMVRYQTTMLDLQAQIVELTGDTVMAEAVLIEQRKIAIAELNASDPTGYLAALTTQLWGLQDAADAAAIAADDAAIAAQAAADAFKLITSSLEVALDDARNILRASIDAEKSAVQAAYETELATAKARVDSVAESVRKLTDLSSLLKSTVTSMAVGVTRESAQAQLSAALAAARAGGALPSADSLQDAIRTLSQPSESKFGSYFDYMRDFITTSNDIAALAELTDDQLTEQEQTLLLAQDSLEMLTLTYDANILRLDGIWEEATGIRYAVIDVATALANFQAATGAVAAAPQVQGLVNQQIAAVQAAGVDPSTYNAMAVTSVASQLESSIADMYQSILGRTADVSGLSAWASSGLSLSMIESQIAASAEAQARAISVGAQNTMIEAVNAALGVATNIRAYATGSNFIDRDQLAMLHRGETVTPAPFVDRERAARDETNALLSMLREEVSRLRTENNAGQVSIARNTNRSAKVLEQFDGDGLPAERVI